MIHGLYLCEAAHLGGQPVAGPFRSAEEAGRWRLEHPPLGEHGPYLRRYENGCRVELAKGDVSGFITSAYPLGAVA